MLYSTIEEAWSKPSLIEGFKTEAECLKECEKLISQISKCDGCMDHFRTLLGKQRDNTFSDIRKYIETLDPVRSLVIILSIFICLFIIVS